MKLIKTKLTKAELIVRIEDFGAAIKDSYPELYDNLVAAMNDVFYWIDEPPTGTIEAAIPIDATHVRWSFNDKCLEFKFKNYWAQPLDGDVTEQL